MPIRPFNLCHRLSLAAVPLIWIVFSGIPGTGIHGTLIPACNVTLPEDVNSGVIHSPNFPFSYLNDVRCHYKFNFPYQNSKTIYRLCLTFHRFDIEHHAKCSYDYLQLDYGAYGRPRLCGNNSIGSLGLLAEPPSFDLTSWPTVCHATSSLRAEIIFKTDITTRFPGFYATYNVSWASKAVQSSICPSQCSNYTCLQYKQKYDERGCPMCECHTKPTAPCRVGEFVCFQSAQCIPRSQLCDGVKDCLDGSDETYEHARCTQSKCKCLSQVGCTFDFNVCEYKTTDSALWRLNSGKTLSKNTGPSFDHTLMAGMTYRYSSFVYFEASYVVAGRKAALHMPSIEVIANETKCFQFWYHMWGEYMGTLELQMKRSNRAGTWVTVWYAQGNQIDMWQVAQVDLVGLTSVERYELRFVATRGQSYTSDMALDDISVLNGKCLRRDYSCTFENGNCGWEFVQEFTTVLYYDTLDHVAVGKVFPPSVTPLLVEAILRTGYITHNIKEPKCLKFKYRKSVKTKMTVDYLEDNGYQHEIAQIFGSTDDWVLYELDIPKVYSAYKIVISVWPYGDFGSLQSDNVYIDDIYFRDGPCTMAATTQSSFCKEAHQFLCYNGHCVKQSDRCDGYDDCKDNSDEESLYANCTGMHCPRYNFRCANGHCVYSDFKCNGVDDCGDNSDEDLLYSGCTSGVSVGGILGIIFGIICSLILVCTLSVFICKYTKQRQRFRDSQERRQRRQAARRSSAYAISHSSQDMMPPPYHAVVNEGFVGDSLYEIPPSYESIVADNNNGSTTLLTVPPYSVVDPRTRSTNPPSSDPSSQTETVLCGPSEGTSNADMVLHGSDTSHFVPHPPHSSPPDIVTCALNSNQLAPELSRTVPSSPSPPSTSEGPPSLPPPSVAVETDTDAPKDNFEGENIITNDQPDNQ